ncbi:hypothetical protein [Pelagibius sp.]|uniref:hypothetical protein n=1 Tax=Pelagibius sp. TaxID=1931238 RepID=UPI0026373D85|nr:hypothetical protein [Pelagibius sp.]
MKTGLPARVFVNTGCSVGLGMFLACAWAAGESRAVVLEAGVASFDAASGRCGPGGYAGNGPAGAETEPAGGAAPGQAGTQEAAVGLDSCFEAEALLNALGAADPEQAASAQTVLTQITGQAIGSGERRDRLGRRAASGVRTRITPTTSSGGMLAFLGQPNFGGAGDVSVSMSYDSLLLSSDFDAPSGSSFRAPSNLSSSSGEDPLFSVASEFHTSSSLGGNFGNSSQFGNPGSRASLLPSYRTDPDGGQLRARQSGAGNTEEQVKFWKLAFGVLGMVAAAFGILWLFGLFVEFARRRAV